MAYLYRHIRLDKNEVFYIGIGKEDEEKYRRAYDKNRRSALWKSIVKHHLYEVEIILDNLTWKQACEKELEFINLYGKIKDKTGTLANITSGGDGGDTTRNRVCIYKGEEEKKIFKEDLSEYEKLGWKRGFSESHLKKASLIKIGKKYSYETNKKKGRPGHKHKDSTIEKMRNSAKGVKKEKVKCPNCGLIGAPSPMKRWHFENCKK
jgi:hypothetical protein